MIVATGVLTAACGGPASYEEPIRPGPGATLPAAEPVTAAPLDGAGDGDGAAADGTVIADGPGGLVERLPDTCQLDNYRQFVGQDALISASQVIDRPVRVIAPDAIVSQVYNPQRVNFYTDGAGRVVRISCG
jgi:hypothetical protein